MELMHECCNKHLLLGTARIKLDTMRKKSHAMHEEYEKIGTKYKSIKGLKVWITYPRGHYSRHCG